MGLEDGLRSTLADFFNKIKMRQQIDRKNSICRRMRRLELFKNSNQNLKI
jgi:hypothetical protein